MFEKEKDAGAWKQPQKEADLKTGWKLDSCRDHCHQDWVMGSVRGSQVNSKPRISTEPEPACQAFENPCGGTESEAGKGAHLDVRGCEEPEERPS